MPKPLAPYLISLVLLLMSIFTMSCGSPETTSDDLSAVQVFDYPELPKTHTNADTQEMLNRIAEKYRSFKYYKASGKSEYTKKGFGDPETTATDILIDIEYPKKFHVEVQTGTQKLWIDKEAPDKFLITDGNKKEYRIGPSQALESNWFKNNTGYVPAKLLALTLKEGGGWNIADMRNNLQFMGEEEIDGKPCYKFVGVNDEIRVKTTWWVDKESIVIRKYEQYLPAKQIPGGYFKSVETYSDIETR